MGYNRMDDDMGHLELLSMQSKMERIAVRRSNLDSSLETKVFRTIDILTCHVLAKLIPSLMHYKFAHALYWQACILCNLVLQESKVPYPGNIIIATPWKMIESECKSV